MADGLKSVWDCGLNFGSNKYISLIQRCHMSEDQFVFSFSNIPVKEIAPGYMSKLIHTASNTINFIEVEAGRTVPEHQHVHEQVAFVLEGQFELTIQGVPHLLHSGRYAVIPSNTLHSGRAVTNCRLIDVFSPVREDYRILK